MSDQQYSGMQQSDKVTYTPAEPQQSQNAVIISQPNSAPGAEPTTEERPSAVLPIVLSCFVTFCCCCCLGIAAFAIAIYAGTKEVHREYREKLSLSKKVSIAGIIIGIICWIVGIVGSVLGGNSA